MLIYYYYYFYRQRFGNNDDCHLNVSNIIRKYKNSLTYETFTYYSKISCYNNNFYKSRDNHSRQCIIKNYVLNAVFNISYFLYFPSCPRIYLLFEQQILIPGI